MKRIILLLIPFLIAAAPSRTDIYTSGETISSTAVTANEDAIFNYLQSGVDTYSAGSVTNAAVSNAANIQCTKLNLTACTQAITTTGAITSSAGVTGTGLTVSVQLQPPVATTCSAPCNAGSLCFDSDQDTNGSLMVCANNGTWKDVDDD